MPSPSKPILDPSTLDMLRVAIADQVPLAEHASTAAQAVAERDMDAAAVQFDRVARDSDDARLLFAAFQFFFRTGDLARALCAAEKRRQLAEARSDVTELARACTNLGLVHLFAGRVDQALDLCRLAVEIDQRSGNLQGLARDLGNLANVHEARGELDLAADLNHRSLALAREIGDLHVAVGKLANLGDIALAQRDRPRARQFWSDARALADQLALDYLVAQLTGKLDAPDA